MKDQFDDTPIIEFIKEKQKEGLLPKGRIKIHNVKSKLTHTDSYAVFRCRIKRFFKKPHYLNLIMTNNGKIKEFQGDGYDDFDEWDFFNF